MSHSRRHFIATLAAALVAPSFPARAGLLPMATVFIGSERFDALIAQIKPKAERIRGLSIGQRACWFGQVFLGTPYKGFTLEIDDKIEAASVNLNGLDCWTFFEVSLALARMVMEPEENWTPKTMLRYIELDRYWGGKCDGTYLSRLHYLEDWLHDNARRGLVRDLTRTLGGRGFPNSATEMTNHWKGYRYMRNNPEYRVGISQLEARLRKEPLVFIPKANIPAIEDKIQSGDIISIVSYDGDAYGTSHVGLAYRTDDGVLRLMHASAPANHGKVVVDMRLIKYLDHFKRNAGIMVARPLK